MKLAIDFSMLRLKIHGACSLNHMDDFTLWHSRVWCLMIWYILEEPAEHMALLSWLENSLSLQRPGVNPT